MGAFGKVGYPILFMGCGEDRAASRGGHSPTRPPCRSRQGELIKLATRFSNWVGCPAPPKVRQVAAVLRGRTPANTPTVFASGGCRRVDNVVNRVRFFVILKLHIKSGCFVRYARRFISLNLQLRCISGDTCHQFIPDALVSFWCKFLVGWT